MDFRKLLVWICVAFVIFFIISSPDNAAAVTHSLWNATVNVAHSIGRFFSSLSS